MVADAVTLAADAVTLAADAVTLAADAVTIAVVVTAEARPTATTAVVAARAPEVCHGRSVTAAAAVHGVTARGAWKERRGTLVKGRAVVAVAPGGGHGRLSRVAPGIAASRRRSRSPAAAPHVNKR